MRDIHSVEFMDDISPGRSSRSSQGIEAAVGDYVACGAMPILMRTRKTGFVHPPEVGLSFGRQTRAAAVVKAHAITMGGVEYVGGNHV